MKFKDYLKEFESHYNSKNGRTAWEKAEEKYFENHVKSKYRRYQSITTMKSRKKNKKI